MPQDLGAVAWPVRTGRLTIRRCAPEDAAAMFAYRTLPEVADYLYEFDLSTWGWIHLVLGLLGICVGVGILMRRSWAQLTGVMIAGLSMLANFAFLPYYPFWAMTIIALNVLVIWALIAHGRELEDRI